MIVGRRLPFIGAAGVLQVQDSSSEDRLLLADGTFSNGFWPVIG